MTVDGGAVAGRLRLMVPPNSPALPLVDQLADGMSDESYLVVSTALVRVLARKEAG